MKLNNFRLKIKYTLKNIIKNKNKDIFSFDIKAKYINVIIRLIDNKPSKPSI